MSSWREGAVEVPEVEGVVVARKMAGKTKVSMRRFLHFRWSRIGEATLEGKMEQVRELLGVEEVLARKADEIRQKVAVEATLVQLAPSGYCSAGRRTSCVETVIRAAATGEALHSAIAPGVAEYLVA